MSKKKQGGYVLLDGQYRLVPYTYGWMVVGMREGKNKKGDPVIREETLAYLSRLEHAIRWLLGWNARKKVLSAEVKTDLKGLDELLSADVEKIIREMGVE